MIVGIRVEAENIQTGKVKHCNSSYFTMVAKDEKGNNTQVHGLILENFEAVRRFYNCLQQIEQKKLKIIMRKYLIINLKKLWTN